MSADLPDSIEQTTTPLRIAVTGGSGRVGRRIVIDLSRRGHQVINMDRLTFKDQPGRFAFVDLRERSVVQLWFEQVDAVVHLGEIPNAGAPFSPDTIFGHNSQVGALVLQTAADLKLRHVVYASTCQVYGSWGQGQLPPLRLPIDESYPVRPQNVYALAKVGTEAFARQVARDTGLSISVFRLPWVMNYEYGEADFKRFEEKREEGPIHDLATYVYHGDVARACALAIEKALPGCETYHLSANDVSLNRPLAAWLRRHNPEFPALPDGWGDFQSPLVTDKARRQLGWEPRWNLHKQAQQWRQAGA